MSKTNFHSVYTRTLWAPISKVFPPNSADLMYARVARLVVLYEDSRIEVMGMSADLHELTRLDSLGMRYRELYFMRRATATLVEFSGAVVQLQQCQTFVAFKGRVSIERQRPWSEAAAYFVTKHDELKKVRDAVGGHFSSKAAAIAVNETALKYDTKVEFQSDLGELATVRSDFATEFVATALLTQCAGNTSDERKSNLFRLLEEAHEHAAAASRFLLVEYVWPRFER